MKKIKICFSILLIMAFITSCTGLNDDLQGMLNIFTPFTAKTDAGNKSIEPGNFNAKIKFEKGIIGVKNPKIVVKLPDSQLKISIPRQSIDIKKQSIKASAKDIEQSFSLEGSVKETVLKAEVVEGKRSCKKCDMCLQTVGSVDFEGKMVTGTKMAFNCSCAGEEDVLNNQYTMENRYVLNFLNPHNEKLATFTGKGERYIRTSLIKVLGQCR